jgi:hypothetical protein
MQQTDTIMNAEPRVDARDVGAHCGVGETGLEGDLLLGAPLDESSRDTPERRREAQAGQTLVRVPAALEAEGLRKRGGSQADLHRPGALAYGQRRGRHLSTIRPCETRGYRRAREGFGKICVEPARLLVLGVLMAAVGAGACVPRAVPSASAGCTVIGDARVAGALEALYDPAAGPLLVMGTDIVRCGCGARRLAGDVEERRLAGDVEERRLAGDVEERRLSGDVEERRLAGDVEERRLAGDVEARRLDGDVEERRLAGDVEARRLAGDVEERRLSGDVEERRLAGDVEARRLSGATEAASCQETPGCRGFVVTPARDVQVFDGRALQPVVDGCVPW